MSITGIQNADKFSTHRKKFRSICSTYAIHPSDRGAA